MEKPNWLRSALFRGRRCLLRLRKRRPQGLRLGLFRITGIILTMGTSGSSGMLNPIAKDNGPAVARPPSRRACRVRRGGRGPPIPGNCAAGGLPPVADKARRSATFALPVGCAALDPPYKSGASQHDPPPRIINFTLKLDETLRKSGGGRNFFVLTASTYVAQAFQFCGTWYGG